LTPCGFAVGGVTFAVAGPAAPIPIAAAKRVAATTLVMRRIMNSGVREQSKC
jgi:hypothetical protein